MQGSEQQALGFGMPSSCKGFSRITYIVMQTCTVPGASATRTRKQIILFLQDSRLYRAVVVIVSLGGVRG